MGKLIKIVITLYLSMIFLTISAPALAQLQGTPMASQTMPMETSDKGMIATLMDTKDTSMAASVMKTGDLEGIVKPEGDYTLFVASDSALKATSPDLMNTMMGKLKDRQFAIYFVKGHLVSGMIMPDDIADSRTLTLMNGKTITVRKADGKLMVDDANIVKAVKTGNGMIYVMDRIPESIKAMLA